MGFLWFDRKREIDIMNDLELYEEKERKTALKRLAIETVISFISRTIIQSEFRIKQKGDYVHDDLYYWFNVKPNTNQSAAEFWQQVIYKLIYDGECLIVKTDKNDLLISDDYTRKTFAVYPDLFENVTVDDFTFERSFNRDEVVYLKYGNSSMEKLVDDLFCDYGELLGRLFEYQLRKNQIRGTVTVDGAFKKNDDGTNPLQNFINKMYKSFRDNTIAIVPEQKGFTYKEHSTGGTAGASVDEINKLSDGFIDQVANAVGIPVTLLKGDKSESQQAAMNYMKFCIDPIIKIISSEFNRQFVTKNDYLSGDRIDIRRASYRDIFDLAVSVDKLRSSSVMNGNELRDILGLERSDEAIHDKYIMTKNYTSSEDEALKGGENE